MSFIQYVKDTQGELRHVAWPTRLQTIVYTILVALISVGVSLYLGLFDYIFTTGLSRVLLVLPATNPVSVEQPLATSTDTTSTIPLPQFTVQPTDSTSSPQATPIQ